MVRKGKLELEAPGPDVPSCAAPSKSSLHDTPSLSEAGAAADTPCHSVACCKTHSIAVQTSSASHLPVFSQLKQLLRDALGT